MELSTLEEWKTHLMTVDEQFRHLVEEHAKLDQRVTELEAKEHPTDDEVNEELHLKKVKLRLKDQIAELAAKHRSGGKAALQGVA